MGQLNKKKIEIFSFFLTKIFVLVEILNGAVQSGKMLETTLFLSTPPPTIFYFFHSSSSQQMCLRTITFFLYLCRQYNWFILILFLKNYLNAFHPCFCLRLFNLLPLSLCQGPTRLKLWAEIPLALLSQYLTTSRHFYWQMQV